MDSLERELSEIHRRALFESMNEPEMETSLISYKRTVLLQDLQGEFLTAVVARANPENSDRGGRRNCISGQATSLTPPPTKKSNKRIVL